MLVFVVGVLAATSAAPWWFRVPAGAMFAAGTYACVDAMVFTASWRFTTSALKVPTLLSRTREIVGRADLSVELHDGWWSWLAIEGPGGTRRVMVNPLVSARDLRRWWNSVPD